MSVSRAFLLFLGHRLCGVDGVLVVGRVIRCGLSAVGEVHSPFPITIGAGHAGSPDCVSNLLLGHVVALSPAAKCAPFTQIDERSVPTRLGIAISSHSLTC